MQIKYEPVIESVYKEYKGMKNIEEALDDGVHLEEDYAKMPARSRILFAEDGIDKMVHIDATLKRYSGLSVTELVNIINVAGGPWDALRSDWEIIKLHSKKCNKN